MALDVEIRRYELGDEKECREIIRSSVKTIEEYGSEKISHLRKVLPDMVTGFASGDDFTFYVAETDDGVIGFAGFEVDTGTIGGIFVNPDRMDEGVGSRLMDRIEQEASEAGTEELKASASISAREFYEKNGFTVIEKDTDHEIEGEQIAVYRMKKEL